MKLYDQAQIALLENYRRELADAEDMLSNIIALRREGKRIKALEQRFRVALTSIKKSATKIKRATMEE